jgi:hypothetical protein
MLLSSSFAGDYSGYEDAPMSEAGDDGAEDDVVSVEVLLVYAHSSLLLIPSGCKYCSTVWQVPLLSILASVDMQADDDYNQAAQEDEDSLDEDEEEVVGGLSDEEISD